MKKKYTLSVLFLVAVAANYIHAQTTGVKFAPDHTHWSAAAAFRTSTSNIANVNCNIYIKGDTTINTKYCQKIFKSNSQYFDTTCLQFYGYMYFNNRKLYTDSTTSIDTTSTLQYDFNLNKGDTFNLYVTNLTSGCNGHNGYYKIPVDSVDSMYYGNKWRKSIVFKQMSGFDFGANPIKWVEGIGDLDHGLGVGGYFNNAYDYAGVALFSFYGFIDYCFCDWGFVQLNCFQEPGYATYGNNCAVGICGTGVNEINDAESIFIYPNPATDKIYIERKNSNPMDMSLYDIVGKQISQTVKSKTTKTEINVSGLSKGIYFVQIKTAEGITVKKIVVAR